MAQTAVNTYNIKPTYPTQQNPAPTGPPGTPAEPTARNAKGIMLPPPPPNSASQPAPGAGNGTPGKNTPVMSGLQPRNASNKDGSSPGEGVSPESARPGSRPIAGPAPQVTPATVPGTVSTPGGPSAISAPSPSQIATPQQISRPQTQSPSQSIITRPSTATTNGIPGGVAAPNPSAMLANRYATTAPGAANGAIGAQAAVTQSNTGMGASTDIMGGVPLANDLFMGLDFPMMSYADEDFGSGMPLDFGPTFGVDETYNLYINDTLDGVNGP